MFAAVPEAPDGRGAMLLDGCANDDLLRIGLFITGTPDDSFETFITGEGFEINMINPDERDATDVGLMGQVTDFTRNGGILFVDPGSCCSAQQATGLRT